jgi:(p)ppGpp synthase/HD superfamily hydrolase
MAVKPLTDLEKKAWDFATKAHHGVNRKFTKLSYFDGHVRKVFQILKGVDTSPIYGAACLLHDVVEDTEVTYEIILKEFGKEVADIVQELSSSDKKIKSVGKANYLLHKMINMSEGALLIKLCDRLQNISDHPTASESFRVKYFNETKFIVSKLIELRQLNKKQLNLLSQINGVLDRMKERYQLQHVESFKKFEKN